MQSGPGDIRQRISLEGDDEVKQKLKDLGKSGAADLAEIEKGIHPGTFDRLGSSFGTLRGRVREFHESFEPVKEQFHQTREAVAKLGEGLANVGERSFPNFKEIFALGAGAGLAGIISFIRHGAAAAEELGNLARGLGVDVEKFQAWKQAASEAGIQGDKFTAMLGRFAGKLHESETKQLTDIGDLAKAIAGDISVLPQQVLRGTQQQVQGTVAAVIRGNRQIGKEAGQSLTQIDSRVSQSVEKGTQLGKLLLQQADLVKHLFSESGVKTFDNVTTDQMARSISNVAAKADEAGKKMRELISHIGGEGLVPATNAFEAIDRYTDSWQHNLSHVVTLWKIEGGKLQPKTLEEGFRDVADRVKEMGSGIQATSFIRQNFGRDAAKLFEVLKNGSHGIHDLGEEFTKLGIGIKASETEIGGKLADAFERTETAVGNLKVALAVGLSPALTPVIEEMTGAIGKLYPKVRELGASIGAQFAPGLKELAHWMSEDTKEVHVHIGWVKTLISVWEGVKGATIFAVEGIKAVIRVLDLFASAINFVFGTETTGTAILAVLAIGKLTGAFKLLGLAGDAAFAIIRFGLLQIPIWIIETLAKMGLLRTAVIGIQTAFAAIGNFFGAGAIATMFAPLLAAIGPVGWILLAIGVISLAIIAWKTDWDDLFGYLGKQWEILKGTVQGVIDVMKAAIALAGRAVSSGTEVDPRIGAPMATGGPVYGPGGIDNVPIWATAGEYIVKTAAVAKYGINFFHALNNMRLPRLGFASGGYVGPSVAPAALRFASGGQVPSLVGGGGRTLHLTIGGETFENLFAPERVAAKIERYSHSKELASNGVKPPWFR